MPKNTVIMNKKANLKGSLAILILLVIILKNNNIFNKKTK